MGLSEKQAIRHDQGNLAWVDLIKAIALLWIILNHLVERFLGGPLLANPVANWLSLADRVAQLRPLDGYGIWTVPLNLIRYIGWAGDEGVQLFLILSGFGLTWGLLSKYGKAAFPLQQFYRRRLGRVYPLWWGAHVLFLALWLITGQGLEPGAKAFLSLLGLRVTPGLFYYFSPAWWFIGLLLQLYLIYPLLWRGLHRLGPLRLLLISCAIAVAARAIGLFCFGDYIDAWQRGAIFITRLPEFVFGISLAAWLYSAPALTDKRLRAPSTLLLALVTYVLSTALALTLLGMAIAPFLLGVSAFVLLYAAIGGIDRPAQHRPGLWAWLGRHSYALFLLHHPLILLLIPEKSNVQQAIVGTVAALAFTLLGGVFLERAVDSTTAALKHWRKHRLKMLKIRTLLKLGAVATATLGLLIGSELLVRQVAPQEILGWGERPSLTPDPSAIGWHLKPSQETRLRWESYDYRVTANALGFPGPQYPEAKTAQTVRILVTGDAFTSAEGVDTDQSWARLLEANLAAKLPGRKVEVLNFAITGYGPNQYAAIVEKFAPIYKPDLILVESFVNDFQDALISNDLFRESIGFTYLDPNSPRAIARLSSLRTFADLHLLQPLRATLQGKPSPPVGYFWGNFDAFDRSRTDLQTTARQRTTDRFKQIQAVANRIGAKVVIPLVPASIQVCQPKQLAYYPTNVNQADSTRFDLEQPQRMMRELTTPLGFKTYDLREPLRSLPSCPYQPHNMHWLTEGHRTVADYVAKTLLADGYFKPTAIDGVTPLDQGSGDK